MAAKASLKLFGVGVSQPVRSVMWALRQKSVPFEIVKMMPFSTAEGGTRSPEFLKLNPAGTIPVLQDEDAEGLVLAESPAILSYLANKYSWEDLYPTPLAERAKVDEYLHWHHSNTRQLTWYLFMPVTNPARAPHDAIVEGPRVARGILADLESKLAANGGYLAGPKLTIADILAHPEVQQLELYEIMSLDAFPNVKRWSDELAELPENKRVIAAAARWKPVFDELAANLRRKAPSA